MEHEGWLDWCEVAQQKDRLASEVGWELEQEVEGAHVLDQKNKVHCAHAGLALMVEKVVHTSQSVPGHRSQQHPAFAIPETFERIHLLQLLITLFVLDV
jgi:hypothetical protein